MSGIEQCDVIEGTLLTQEWWSTLWEWECEKKSGSLCKPNQRQTFQDIFGSLVAEGTMGAGIVYQNCQCVEAS